MLELLRTGRWLRFTAVVIIAIIAFGILSAWQWQRAEDKRQQRLDIQQAQAIVERDLDQVREPWQTVTVMGVFDPNSHRVVRQRPLQGRNGVWMLTQLRLSDDRAVWVNRGWTPAARSAREVPEIPPPPTGEVIVTGGWVPFETDVLNQPDLPTGMIAGVAPNVLPSAGDFPGFIQAQEFSPEQADLVPVPSPNIDEGQNLSYAMQWLLFAVVALGGWWYMLRREARDQTSAN
jgi:cytochrome oxidase assembly protein ShyY1